MELLSVVRGGSLYQDIATALPDASDHNLSTAAKDIEHVAHRLRIEPGSKLAKILGVETAGANTHHHQAVKDAGDGLRAVAWAEDGVIEAVEAADDRFIIGIQSHPESMEEKAETAWRHLFEAFVRAAAKA